MRPRRRATQSIGAALAEATQHRGFWLLTASFFVCGFQTIFVMTHLPAYLVDKGLSARARHDRARRHRPFQHRRLLRLRRARRALQQAADPRLDLRDPRGRDRASSSPRRSPPAGTYLFAAVLGLTWLGTVPLTNSLVGQIFGVKYLSTLFSIAFLGHQLGAFVGAWAGGAVFDVTKSYQPVWLAAIALSVLAAALCIPIDERTLCAPA